MRIACIGEVMIEIVSESADARLNVAGDTYNTAAYLAQLGADVSYVTALGHDTFSQRAIDDMSARGITPHVRRHPSRNIGLYAIDVDATGERSFTYWRSESAARTLFDDADFSALDAFDMIVLSGITLAILPPQVRTQLIKALDATHAQVVYDSNYRPALWPDVDTARTVNMQMWGVTDIALPSFDDECAIHGTATEEEVIARVRSAGVQHGALKRGPAGPLDLAGYIGGSFAPADRVVDTTAAGDSFNAGYLNAIATGKSEVEAMQAGHNLASHVVGARGAIVEL